MTRPGEISAPVEYKTGCALIKLLERQTADLSQYTQVRDSLEQALLGTRRQETFSNWYLDLIATARVDDYLDEYFSTR
jgi:parvulin-like peptidyl-prolyl isomerase